MTLETPIGIAGLGRMGAAMARRLLGLGHSVVVWNRDAAKAAPLVEAGAEAADSPAALAARCPVVITMLFDGPAVEAVYSGPAGLLSGEVTGKLFVDMSTIGPEPARKLGAAVAATGAEFVECPVGGSIGPASEGKLLGLAGGSEAAMARARPLLDLLCRKTVHAGPVGAGAALKLAVNLPLLVYWQALGEAFRLASETGLDGATLAELMADTSGTPTAMKLRAPELATVLTEGGAPKTGFELRGATKDLTAMVAAAAALGAPVPVTTAARDAYAAAEAAGEGGGDAMMMAVRAWRAGTS